MEITRAIYSDWMKDIQEEKILQILAHVKPEPKVLDVGSGAGFLERHVKGAYVVDIDLTALKKVDGVKVLADGRRMPFKPRAFNTIFCLDTVHLLKDGKELEELLSERGTLIASTFCNEYNKKEKLEWLERIFRRLRIKSEFFVGSREQDAVIFCIR